MPIFSQADSSPVAETGARSGRASRTLARELPRPETLRDHCSRMEEAPARETSPDYLRRSDLIRMPFLDLPLGGGRRSMAVVDTETGEIRHLFFQPSTSMMPE